jgi:hypothetical protein
MPSSSRTETKTDIARMVLPPMKTISLMTLSIAFAFIVRAEAARNAVLSVGHFPNIRHVQALVAHNKILFAALERFLHRRWGTGLP